MHLGRRCGIWGGGGGVVCLGWLQGVYTPPPPSREMATSAVGTHLTWMHTCFFPKNMLFNFFEKELVSYVFTLMTAMYSVQAIIMGRASVFLDRSTIISQSRLAVPNKTLMSTKKPATTFYFNIFNHSQGVFPEIMESARTIVIWTIRYINIKLFRELSKTCFGIKYLS